jgi:hypothetical protein
MPAILAPAKKCCDREKKRSAGTIRAEEEIWRKIIKNRIKFE